MCTKIERVRWWMSKGFSILPCQPGVKSLVSGFGQYKKKITDEREAAQWFGPLSQANVAVMCPDGFFILDFDAISVYAKWASQCPSAAQSYTENTPRGGKHVFLVGDVPAGVQLVEGAELKKIVLVSPSQIEQQDYKIAVERPFYHGDALQVLFPLAKPGHATPYALHASQIRHAAVNPLSRIEQIKNHFKISHVLSTYRPNIKIIGDGVFQSCLCPFHRDSKPSFYFSDSKGVWGCHACNVRGDVINLYARFEAVNVREAISRMWAVML